MTQFNRWTYDEGVRIGGGILNAFLTYNIEPLIAFRNFLLYLITICTNVMRIRISIHRFLKSNILNSQVFQVVNVNW